MPVVPSPLSASAIYEYAEKVAEHHAVFAAGGPADMKGLVGALGGRIEVAESFSAPEALTVYDRGSFTVHLPPMTSYLRDRFTIAHELGHYFLHYLQPRLSGAQTFGRGDRNRAETQANYFAAALLMPSDRFERAYRRLGADAWALSDEFGVSPRAVEVRASALGLS